MWLPIGRRYRSRRAGQTSLESRSETGWRSRVAREQGVASFELMLAAFVVGLLVVIAMPALLRTSPRGQTTWTPRRICETR